jgi:uncharacterized protein
VLTDWFFYALAVPAFLIVGISKGGFGGGIGSMGVPLMALAIPVPQAAAIMLPLLVAMDVIGLWKYRKRYARGHMTILLVGAVIGIAIGLLTFKLLDENWTRVMIGTIAVVYTLKDWLFAYFGRPAPAQGPSWPKGVFWSALSGITSFVANAGGPPLQVYLLPLRLDKTTFVATNLVYFACINAMKLGPFAYLGLFSAENLATSLVLLPLAPIGMAMGIWLHKRIPEKPFFFWCNVFLFVTGAKLLWDGVSALLASGGLPMEIF